MNVDCDGKEAERQKRGKDEHSATSLQKTLLELLDLHAEISDGERIEKAMRIRCGLEGGERAKDDNFFTTRMPSLTESSPRSFSIESRLARW